MGTRHVWLALLALLQYAAVPVDGSACPGALTPKSECPSFAHDGVTCTNGFLEDKKCSTDKGDLFYSSNDVTFVKVEQISCEGAAWATKINGANNQPETRLLTKDDNVVCSTKNPTVCPKAPRPKSLCPPGPTQRSCTEKYIFKSCPPTAAVRYISKKGYEPWKKLEGVKCTGEMWRGTIEGESTEHPLTERDNVVCSNDDPTICLKAKGPTSVCPPGVALDFCAVSTKVLGWGNEAGEWKKAERITCDTTTVPDGVWNANMKDATTGKITLHALTDKDKIVCANNDLSLPCMKCIELPDDNCKEDDGCDKGGARKEPGEGECMSFTCENDGDFLLTDTNLAVDKVMCEATVAEKKWMSVGLTPEVPVTAAVCIKQLKCTKKHSKLTSKCEGINDVGCSKVDLKDDKQGYTCPSANPKMFYQKTGDSIWQEASANTITCNGRSGVFKHNAGEFPADANVICATDKPVACPTTDHFVSVCDDLTVRKAGECKELSSFPKTGELSCATLAPSKDLYYKLTDSAPWETVPIKCNSKTGKWQAHKLGGEKTDLDVNTKVICAKADPNLKSCKTDDLKHECDEKVNKAAKCDKPILSAKDLRKICPTEDPPVDYSLYYKTDENSPWVKLPSMICDTEDGKWKDAVGGTELPSKMNVICTNEDPGPRSCMADNTLLSSCDNADGSSACETTTASDDGFECTGKTLYYKRRSDPWKDTTKTLCDKATGEWKDTGDLNNIKKDDIIICATNPNPPITTCPTKLRNTLCTGLEAFGCEAVPIGDTRICPNGKHLYFKKEPTTANTKWMPATSINCVNLAWKIAYEFKIVRNEDFAADTDQIICATSNPDRVACQVLATKPAGFDRKYEFSVPTTQEAGSSAHCVAPSPPPPPPSSPPPPPAPFEYDEQNYQIFSPTNDEYLPNNHPPVCGAEGKWMIVTKKNEEIITTEFGGKIGCRYRECLKCPKNPTAYDPQKDGQIYGHVKESPKFQNSGDCAALSCSPEPEYFVIIEQGQTLKRYFRGTIRCADDKKWKIGENEIEKISCVHMMPCYEEGFQRVDLECPADVPGCTKAEYVGSSDKDKETLTCAQGKMLIRHNSVQNWYHSKTLETKCDIKSGTWDIVLIDQYGKENHTSIDYDHTIICAPENPKPWPTTTTTTTTPAPILPICNECNSTMPKDIVCDKCDGHHIKLTNQTDDECTMMANSKDYKLVINAMEEVDALVCKRGNHKWTKKGGTEAVEQFAARVDLKRQKLTTVSYLIIGATLIAIGGMAIGCVLIYMKMRKQPSERENKKKERGVTKKYLGANMMKTGKSSKKKSAMSKESGASKESTNKSKADSSQLEDAPTLKL